MQNLGNPPTTPPAYLIDSVDHAMRLLLLFQTRRELRVTDAANELQVARSTAHRLLTTLAWRGFVSQDRVTKSYRAGKVLVEIGLSSISELDVRRKAHRHMESLSTSLRETVNLLVLEGNGARFIDGVEGDQPVRVSVRTGTLLPAHSTSGGKVLIAELSSDSLRALFPTGLRRVTAQTTVDFDALEIELGDIRDRGYALNVDESELGLRAIAVAIRDHSGRAIAALAVSMPANRLGPAQVPELVDRLTAAAALISAEIN
jgi:DNA-binding IclR family transcriptional regulator